MEMWLQWGRALELAAWAASAPAVTYLLSYFVLRIAGVLMVAGGGWHAGAWRAGARTIVPALALFGMFEPMLRRESAIRRRLERRVDESAVCEVAVEVAGVV
jgi:hypothetical protein